MESLLGVPIRSRKEVFGDLYLGDHVDGAVSAEDEQLLPTFAATAGVAIETRGCTRSNARFRWLGDIPHPVAPGDPTRDRAVRLWSAGLARRWARLSESEERYSRKGF
jgi:hypothetical protein